MMKCTLEKLQVRNYHINKINSYQNEHLMDHIKVVVFSSMVCTIFITSNVMSAESNKYADIINKYKGDAGKGKCLRTFADKKTVAIDNCTAQGGSSDSPSMRQWQVVKQPSGFFLIKNKYKGDVNQGVCIKSLSGRNELEVGDCGAQEGEPNYSAMALWKIDEKSNYALLQNKYKQEVKQPNCLRTFSNNSSVLIGDCNAKGGASDYSSMRQWMSDAFSIDQPWGPTGIVGIQYTFPEAPKSGFNRITFPLNIEKSPEARGYYYAMQYRFINGNSGYIGLQPRDKDSGLAIFSVFGSGVKPIAPHCTGSADGGEGSSCSKEINLVFGHKYNLTVKRDAHNHKVWRGYVEDTVTGEVNEIGAWQPKDGSQGVKDSEGGFVEYFPQINSCLKLPYTKSYFGAPIADSEVKGSLKKPYIYGKCKGSVEFSTDGNAGGWDVSLKGIK